MVLVWWIGLLWLGACVLAALGMVVVVLLCCASPDTDGEDAPWG